MCGTQVAAIIGQSIAHTTTIIDMEKRKITSYTALIITVVPLPSYYSIATLLHTAILLPYHYRIIIISTFKHIISYE